MVQAKVDYDAFKFEGHRIGFRWFRNVVFILFVLPAFFIVLTRQYNKLALREFVR